MKTITGTAEVALSNVDEFEGEGEKQKLDGGRRDGKGGGEEGEAGEGVSKVESERE